MVEIGVNVAIAEGLNIEATVKSDVLGMVPLMISVNQAINGYCAHGTGEPENMSGPNGEIFQVIFWPYRWWRPWPFRSAPFPAYGDYRGCIYAWRGGFWMWEVRKWG